MPYYIFTNARPVRESVTTFYLLLTGKCDWIKYVTCYQTTNGAFNSKMQLNFYSVFNSYKYIEQDIFIDQAVIL